MNDNLAARLQASLGGAFVLERELGGGGMARVFLARDATLDRSVVVKVLDLEGGSAAESAERFRREVKVIARLQHPHIVPVLTAGGEGSLLWYAMPFVAGESLRARLLREGALPLSDALRITRELLDALGHAHAQGIVHRDVKPENILLESGHAVVADFGVAKALADAGVSQGLTSVGVALGTPAYMAPEQAMADPTTNHRADLYAAGAVLFEMLVGAPPFSGNAQSVIAAHLTSPPPRVDERRNDVPPAVAALTQRLLAKSPAERPQSAHEAMAVLESAATPGGGTVPGVRSTGAAAPSAGPPAPRSARTRYAAVAVVALVATGVFWALKVRAAPSPVAAGADVIAMMPLGSTGDSSLARLGRDLVVTVSANLDHVGSLRTVDASSVLQRAQSLPTPLALDAARTLATELGARSVLHGSLVRDGDLVRADVALYAVEGGDQLAKFTLRAPIDSLRSLTDSMSAEVLRQVWRRGTPPSPLLSDVATSSSDALRAFLEGEDHLRHYDIFPALGAYSRAATLDSNFAQAFLRIDYVRGWNLMGVDPVVRARLIALMDRLPPRDRDRDLLKLRFTTGMPMRIRIDSGRVLAARYADYHTAQYAVADNIIHSGPIVGVPIADALPYLDRLDALAPNHADNALHRLMVYATLGDTVRLLESAEAVSARAASGPLASFGRSARFAIESRRTGRPIPLDTARRVAREGAQFIQSVTTGGPNVWLADFGPPGATSEVAAEWFSGLRGDPAFAGLAPLIRFSEGTSAVRNGDFARGVSLLSEAEVVQAPAAIRLSAARVAAWGAWLGALPVGTADSALARSRARLGELSGLDAAELAWSDAVIGIAAGDSARVWSAAAAIRDTSPVGRSLPRAIRALWRERSAGQVDSLRAYEDEMMARSTTFSSAMLLHRVALGRALVRAGDPAAAEYYLQWPDANNLGLRPNLLMRIGTVFNAYERALAYEAAGNATGAIRNLQLFVETVDRGTPALRALVEDAKQRLGRLLVARR